MTSIICSGVEDIDSEYIFCGEVSCMTFSRIKYVVLSSEAEEKKRNCQKVLGHQKKYLQ